jgi:signal transduction histidine kinase
MRPRTLLIDDEPDFLGLLAARLEAREFPVATALDGQSGLAAAGVHGPQVVVLDVNLPDLSGLDVLRQMRERWPLTQVVMLTGQADVSTAVEGMKLGAFDYLIKPVDIEPLVKVLMRAGERRIDQEESLRMIETVKLAALGRLASGVAHEINNPVNIMMQKAGWAGELLEGPGYAQLPDTAEIRTELDGIVKQGRRCREIVSKLLSLGGRIDPRASTFEVRDAVESALEQARGRAESLGAALSLDCEPGLPKAFLPRTEIEQVVGRLLENALDCLEQAACAGDGPHPRGRVGVLVTGSPSGAVLIEVSDNGPGVPDDIAGRIFEPFFSTREVGQGSGLGLAICHGVMKSLGGDVALKFSGGPGAAFTVTLPSQTNRQ